MAKESANTAKTMGLGDGPAVTAAAVPVVGPQGSVPRATIERPYCQKHNVLMSAYSSKEGVTHYACPVPNCGATAKQARPKDPIPKDPAVCPQVSCRDPKQYLEVDAARSSSGQLAMVCPGCGFTSRVPRPQIAFVNQAIQREAAEDLGVR